MSDFDLAIIGTGSGASVITDEWAGRRVALVSNGVFGGTCLNRGCIPTKMFVYAAEVAETIQQASRYGVDGQLTGVRWPDIRDRIFTRIDSISDGGRDYRVGSDNVTLFEGWGTFEAPHRLRVEGGRSGGVDSFSAEQVVVATGSRPIIPPVVTASGVPFATSEDVMRIDELPGRIVILGGGYIAAEFAHVFSSLGAKVHVVTRGRQLLGAMDPAISSRFTEHNRTRWDVHLECDVVDVHRDGAATVLVGSDGTRVAGDLLLVATGRQPNSDGMGLAEAGIEVRPDGRVRVDEFGRTTAEGVWALGDVSSPFQLKHVANAETRAVAHNLTHPGDLRAMPHRFVPSAVFTDPQVASVGATSTELDHDGRHYVSATQQYGDTAYGWAMEDRTGICRLYADPATGLLLGAHLLGYQASNLVQPLVQAMSFGQTVADVARGQYWIHPALMEVVENALLQLPLDLGS